MRIYAALVFGLASMTAVADGDSIALAKLAKQQIIEACGNDEDCAYAVKMQFDGCHRRFRKEWQAYMDTSGSEEDRWLERYLSNLYACIVDENGEPYFEYNGQ